MCRVAEMLRRLRARGHHVTVTTCGPRPPPYTRELVGEFEHVTGPGLAMRDGALDPARTLLELARTFPGCVRAAASLARRLRRERVDLVLSDYDLLSAWASGLAGVPSAGVAGQYRVHRTRGPRPEGRFLHATSFPVLEGAAVGLSRIFAISFCAVTPTRAGTEVIGPIVEAELRDATPRRDDITLVYVTAPTDRVVAALAPSGARFRVCGGHAPGVVGDIELCATDRRAFRDDLIRCRAVILNGGFQSVCEAAILGKPILSVPIPLQYESLFNAHQLAASGLGITSPVLDAPSVARLLALTPPPAPVFADGAAQVIARLGL